MIKVELDKKDLLRLVYGIKPYYSLFEYLTEHGYGNYCKGKATAWEWNEDKIKNMTEQKLWDLYDNCKNSLK